jgi:transcriptional regulator with XRE-family HTH domain
MAETLGQRIRRKRMERDIGLREMARMVDISPAYLSRVETDEERTPPGEDTIKRIAKVIGDDVNALMHLAGRVPSDVGDMLKEDPSLPQFLRTAKARGFTGKELEQLLDKAKGKRS